MGDRKKLILPRQGGFRKLLTFRLARLNYDLTIRFCHRYISRFSRTREQMIQAARSGVQNIAEGSAISGTSKELEMKLVNIARGSLEELHLDYEDFLRQNGYRQWEEEDRRRKLFVSARCATVDEVARWVRDVGMIPPDGRDGPDGQNEQLQDDRSLSSTQSISSIRSSPAEASANTILVLIEVTVSLLGNQVESLMEEFLQNGGFRERLYRERKERRK